MQLTGWDNANNMRNAKCVETQTSIEWPYCSFSMLCRGVVAPPRKLFPNWTEVSLRTTHDLRIKFKRANEKHSSEQVLHFPGIGIAASELCMWGQKDQRLGHE